MGLINYLSKVLSMDKSSLNLLDYMYISPSQIVHTKYYSLDGTHVYIDGTQILTELYKMTMLVMQPVQHIQSTERYITLCTIDAEHGYREFTIMMSLDHSMIGYRVYGVQKWFRTPHLHGSPLYKALSI